MTLVLCVPGAASWSQYNVDQAIGTLKTGLGGPQALIEQLGLTDKATIVPVAYNDLDSFNGYRDAAKKINDMLTAVHRVHPTEDVVLYGHSFGAVGNCEWIRSYSHLVSGAVFDPDQLTIVNIGNSVRPKTGLMGIVGFYGGTGPVGGRYRTIDIAAEYDKWADYPNVTGSPQWWNAFNNVNSGDNYPEMIHVNGYKDLRFTQPHASATIGGVEFKLFPSSRTLAAGVTKAGLATAYSRIVG